MFPPIEDFGPIEADATDREGVLISGVWRRARATPTQQYNRAAYLSSAHSKDKLSVTFLMEVPATGHYKITFIHPVSKAAGTKVPVSFTAAGGTRTVYVNQQKESRQSIGVFKLLEGTVEIAVSNTGVPSEQSVFVGRLRLDFTHAPAPAASNWRACRDVETTFKQGGFEVYHFFRDPIPTPAVTFTVQASNDAHVALAPSIAAGAGAQL